MSDDDEASDYLIFEAQEGAWPCQTQYAGVASAGVSVLAHIVLVTYLNMNSVGAAAGLSIGKWPLTERCFLHMAFLNSLFSSCHVLDLLRICAMQTTAPSDTCKGFAAIFHTRVIGECQMATTAACLACVIYARAKPMDLGKYQWKLFMPMYLLPLALSISLMFVPDLMGDGGPWCFIELHTVIGQHYIKTLVCIIFFLWLFGSVASVVIIVLISKRRSEAALGETVLNALRAAESLLVFVPLCIINLFMLTIYLVWSMFQRTPYALMLAIVVWTNLHGILYCVAYGIIRHRCTIITLPKPKTPAAIQLQQLSSFDEARDRGIMNIHDTMARMELEQQQQQAPGREGDTRASKRSTPDGNKAFTNLHYVEDIEI